MPGPKTNEREGTRAVLRYSRTSPYKVREVLSLVRGLDIDDARHVLQFSERGPARDVLKVASVLGLTFEIEALRALAGAPADEHRALLAELALIELDDVAATDGALRFGHSLTREVIYERLLYAQRRSLHRQVAQAIEARYAARLQPYYSRLAYHYQMAENATRAVDYLLKAAQHAASVYAFVNVAEYMKTALDLLIGDEERPMRAGLLRQLSDIYIYTGRIDKAIEAGMASAALWRDLGDEAKQAEAYLYVAFCWHWQEFRSANVMKRSLCGVIPIAL